MFSLIWNVFVMLLCCKPVLSDDRRRRVFRAFIWQEFRWVVEFQFRGNQANLRTLVEERERFVFGEKKLAKGLLAPPFLTA